MGTEDYYVYDGRTKILTEIVPFVLGLDSFDKNADEYSRPDFLNRTKQKPIILLVLSIFRIKYFCLSLWHFIDDKFVSQDIPYSIR